MKLKQLFTDDDAVSPVIGVILMVAITVILAAVIASLVLGLGDEPTQTPSAQFEFDYDDSAAVSEGDGVLTISHNGGNTIDANEIEVRGSGAASDTFPADWRPSETSDSPVTVAGSSEVSTGDSVLIEVNEDYEVTVTWVPPGGGDTSPLASDEGPEA